MTLTIKQPWDVPELDLNAFQYKFLAESDSWFSIGEFPPWATSSLLFGMSRSFAASNLVINCASQGDSLSHMHQMWYDSNFTRMLDAPHLGYYWDALLLSAGGNDLIDACLVAPTVSDPAQRLLLRPEEIPSGAPPEACISTGGWQAFEGYLRANFSNLVQRIFVFDSQDPAIGVVPALPGASGVSNDFENEIHLTPAGYRKVGAAFAAFIDSKL